MSERIDRDELVRRVSKRVAKKETVVAQVVDATLEEIYQDLSEPIPR